MNKIRQAVHDALSEEAKAKTIQNDYRHLNIEFLRTAINFSVKELESVTGRLQDPKSRIAISLFCTIFQLAESILMLSEKKPNLATPTIGRQLLDAFVDLKNVVAYEHYWKSLELADDQSWKKALEIASKKENPYFQSISESDQLLISGRTQHAERINEWTRQGIKKKEIDERFSLADMTHEYESVWSWLSSYAHNSMSMLISRHFEINEDQQPKEILLEPATVPFEISVIGHSGELLFLATKLIHENFGNKYLDTSEIDTALQELRAKLT